MSWTIDPEALLVNVWTVFSCMDRWSFLCQFSAAYSVIHIGPEMACDIFVKLLAAIIFQQLL